MLRRLAVVTVAVIASISSSIPSAAQAASPAQAVGGAAGETDADKWKTEKWNTSSPPESYWEKVKSAAAPKRDITGIWDGGGVPQGVQPNGAYEYPDDPEHVGKDVP